MISHFQTAVIKYIIKFVYQRQNCPFFRIIYFILKIKIAYRRNFAVLELYGIFGKKIKLQKILRKKNF